MKHSQRLRPQEPVRWKKIVETLFLHRFCLRSFDGKVFLREAYSTQWLSKNPRFGEDLPTPHHTLPETNSKFAP